MFSIPSGLDLLALIPALLIALTFHEYAHARMAYFWGDPTAKNEGRLTLNPLSHLDPIGLLMLMIVRFGWAKPVPINPFNFRDRRKGLFWVSLAGPGMNLLLGFIATFILIIYGRTGTLLSSVLFNLIIINVFLAVFNMVPLPPLDGSKILSALLPSRCLQLYHSIEPYGPFILILLLIFGGLRLFLVPIAYLIIDIYQTLVITIVSVFL
ncbi:MAG: site-2 protease family protein [Bacillota bacterium]|nr:site-2 protease family protein [Bacillota bacterium]